MDGVTDAVKRNLPVRPAKKVVTVRSAAAAGFDQSQTGKQPPVQIVGIRFRHEYLRVILVGALLVFQKLAENRLPQIELFAIPRHVLVGMHSSCRNSEDSRENHNTGGQKALHNMSFSLE